ncbi:MAG: hypothetical protein IPN20_00430 [Haliscomenobacter sp.]|nr:hypothetical protein [Haliscomenobacter sp.]
MCRRNEKALKNDQPLSSAFAAIHRKPPSPEPPAHPWPNEEAAARCRRPPGRITPWADFDHPDADSYGRKMAYKGPNFEIMVMSWKPGDFSSIHDHGHTQWGSSPGVRPCRARYLPGGQWEDQHTCAVADGAL